MRIFRDVCVNSTSTYSSVIRALGYLRRLLWSAVHSAQKGGLQILLQVCKEFWCSFQLTTCLLRCEGVWGVSGEMMRGNSPYSPTSQGKQKLRKKSIWSKVEYSVRVMVMTLRYRYGAAMFSCQCNNIVDVILPCSFRYPHYVWTAMYTWL